MNKKTRASVYSNDPAYLSNPEYEKSRRGRLWKNPIIYLPHTLSPLLSITGGRITKAACFGTREGSYVAEGMGFRDMQQAIMAIGSCEKGGVMVEVPDFRKRK